MNAVDDPTLGAEQEPPCRQEVVATGMGVGMPLSGGGYGQRNTNCLEQDFNCFEDPPATENHVPLVNGSLGVFDVEVSMVRHATDTITRGERLRAIFDRIRTGVYRELVSRVRTASAEAEAKAIAASLSAKETYDVIRSATDALKKQLPAVMWSGTFSRRATDALIQHSGLICVDLDHLDARVESFRDLIVADEHTLGCFVSPSGMGLKVIFRCDPAREHLESYRAAERFMLENFGVEIDPACKDVSRLCFISHDADVFIAPDATVLEYPPERVEFVAPQEAMPGSRLTAGLTPGDDFDQRGDFPALLKKAGWTPCGRDGWTRPGKTSGVSATWNKVPGRFFVFSSSAAPLEANHVYRPWHIFSLLECGGDFHRAAKELAARGYGSVATSLNTVGNPWPALVPFSRVEPPSLELAKCIPPALAPFRDYCTAVAEALQVQTDAVVPLALALTSIGTARALEVEPMPGWRETGNLWTAVLLDSAERKSALLKLISCPLHEWQGRERAYLAPALAAYDEKRIGLCAQLAGVREKQKKATGPQLATLKNEALELRAKVENMPELKSPELVADDINPEGVRDRLARNGERLAIVTAETDEAQLLGNRYAKTGAPNINLLLKCKGGDSFNAGRVGRDVNLDGPLVSMAIIVQATAVAEVLRDPYSNGRGLVPRFWFIAPRSMSGYQTNLHPDPVPTQLVAWWAKTLRELLDLPWQGRVILNSDGPARYEMGPRVLRLTSEATAILDPVRHDLIIRQREGNDLHTIRAFAAKLAGEIVRIALVLQAMQDPAAEVITAETMSAAVEWAPFLLAHFRAVLGDASETVERRNARRLASAIRRLGLTELTAREAFNLIDGAEVPTMAALEPVLTELVGRNYLRLAPGDENSRRAPGRPASPSYQVNPAIGGQK